MKLIISTQSELLKIKGTSSFWISLVGAAFIPTILFISFFTDNNIAISLKENPWDKFIFMGWRILGVFSPMYIILICTLIPQIEFRNNTWKQVFSAPLSYLDIFLSKFLSIHLLILSCFIMFNILMIASALAGNMLNPNLTFLDNRIDWMILLQLNIRTYISILGISSIQYYLSLKFKNFIWPVGFGLAFLISGVIALNFNWAFINLHPYTYLNLTLDAVQISGSFILLSHEWNSMCIFILFQVMGYFDMKLRKEKG